MGLVAEQLADQIRRAPDPEATGRWPAERLVALRDAGVFRWGLPVKFGGLVATRAQLLDGYLELARCCLTTAFILTQRDAACHRIANSPNLELRQLLLPDHCAGRAMATVGISHLSTSRQHWSRPSVVATRTANGYELTGEAPWVTGAGHADLLVTGATLESGEQILVAIPTDRPGVNIAVPLRLMALNESSTGSVNLERVPIKSSEIVLGPVPQVMKVGATGGTGSLTTSAVAAGAAAHTLDGIRQEVASRPDLSEVVARLSDEQNQLRNDILAASEVEGDPATIAEELRLRANSLAARAAHAYICCAKGAGFVSGHPAERAMREAMFFQVWSCPPAVTRETLTTLGSS